MIAALKHRLNKALDSAADMLDDMRQERVAAEEISAATQIACKLEGIEIARRIVFTVLTDLEREGK